MSKQKFTGMTEYEIAQFKGEIEKKSLKRGMELGRIEERKIIAKALKDTGMSLSQISQITKLNIKEIAKL